MIACVGAARKSPRIASVAYTCGRFLRIVLATHLRYVEGQVERESDVINVMARRVQSLAPVLVDQGVRT